MKFDKEVKQEQPKRKVLNKEQGEELSKIILDKYSYGAFSGMIFNKLIDSLPQDGQRVATEEFEIKRLELIKEALNVRIMMNKLNEE